MSDTIEDICEKAKPVFEKYGVTRARIAGSFARGDAREDSDVDLILDFEKPLGFSYVQLQDELENCLGRDVDVMTEGSINKFFRPYIMRDVKPLYERG